MKNKVKCEIITIYSINYGNRLQNYALQEAMKKLGVEVTTNRIANLSYLNRIKMVVRRLRMKTKIDYFVEFDHKINWRYTGANEIIDSKDIDYFVAGSDQIWNPLFDFNSDREFLTFTTSDKKIAYAASIGINDLDLNQTVRFSNNLSDFKAISVRENQALQLLKPMLKKNIKVVLDPTMLLTSKEWDKVIEKSRIKIDYPYVVKYFIGIRNEFVEKQINDYAQNRNYKIIDITSENTEYVIGPVEFLYLLKNSKFNFVDSFHGTVFSILFEKLFFTFKRPDEDGYGDMNSRFSTIFDMLCMGNRYMACNTNLDFGTNIDYKHINAILERKRKDSYDFLKKALNIE